MNEKEIEILARKIDSVRSVIERSTTEWAKNHWQYNLNNLIRKYRAMVGSVST